MMRFWTFLVLRLVAMVPTLALVVLISFLLLNLGLGDAADAYLAQTGGDGGFAAQLRALYGLDRPVAERFLVYAGHLLRGELGMSIVHGRPVADVLLARLPNTLALMAGALIVAVLGGALLGTVAGAKPQSFTDKAAMALALLLFAMPNFWLAFLLLLGFGLLVPVFPLGGAGSAWHFVLPSLALGLGYAALYARTLRAGMAEAWQRPMVRAAQARGLSSLSILRRYVLRPVVPVFMAVMGQNIATLIGGSIVVETLFAIPGLGLLSYEAISSRDPFLLAGLLLLTSTMVMLIQLVADCLIHLLDPVQGVPHV